MSVDESSSGADLEAQVVQPPGNIERMRIEKKKNQQLQVPTSDPKQLHPNPFKKQKTRSQSFASSGSFTDRDKRVSVGINKQRS